MTADRWRVALVEDDAETRHFFERCISAHAQLALVASCATLAAARAWFAEQHADVLLTDLQLPDGHGLDLIREVAAQQPGCEILVVSVFGDEDSVLGCIAAGAVGYIHKDSRPADVAQAIVDIRQGASPISPMIARKLLAWLRRGAAGSAPAAAAAGPFAPATVTEARGAEPPIVLTPRQTEVLELVARGYRYAEIARLQGVSMHTVQTHIKNLYARLAVHSRSEAVFEAGRLGLLAWPGAWPGPRS